MSLTENPQGNYAEEALQKYGYRQEFRRELKRFAIFAIGFSFISKTAHSYQLPHWGCWW